MKCGVRGAGLESLQRVQGEQLVNGSLFCGLPATVRKGHSVGRAECPHSECKGLMLA